MLTNNTFDHHHRRTDVHTPTAGPSSSPLPSPLSSPSYEQRRGSFDEDDEEETERAQAKQRECARRVAAWITQSAVRITAITTPYGASTASFDLLDFDLEEEEEEPYILYSTKPAPVIHAPVPRRPRSSRRRHGHPRPRVPSPLYVIPEEDSE